MKYAGTIDLPEGVYEIVKTEEGHIVFTVKRRMTPLDCPGQIANDHASYYGQSIYSRRSARHTIIETSQDDYLART